MDSGLKGNLGKILAVFSLVFVGVGLFLSLFDSVLASFLEIVGLVSMILWFFALRIKAGPADYFEKKVRSPYYLVYLLFSFAFLMVVRAVRWMDYPTYRLLLHGLLFVWFLSFVLIVYLYVIKE